MASGQPDLLLQHLRRLVTGRGEREVTDRELLRRFAVRHDQDAFAALVDRHGAMVLRVCSGVLRHRQDAEDAFQATFLVLARRAGSVRWQESVAPWLHGVARHVALKARAAAACRRRHEGQLPERPAADSFADLTIREAQALLDEELGRLPAAYRGPLVLCYLEGKTQDEAARELGWSKATLRRRLERGRELLRSRLGRRGLVLPAALCAAALCPEPAPAALMAATADAAVRLAAGGVVAAPVARLVEEAGRAALVTPWKLAAALLLAGVAAAGVLVLAHPPGAGEQPAAPMPAQAATDTQARTDRYGDPLPDGAVARLGTLRFYHGSQVNWLRFSPDGKFIVSTGMDRNRLWETATGRELPLAEVSQVGELFVFRGRLLVAETNQRTGEAHMRDVANGTDLFAAAWQAGTMHIRDLTSDKELSPTEADKLRAAWKEGIGPRRGQDAAGGQRAVSPDGRILATVDVANKRIRLQDAHTQEDLPPLLDQPTEDGPMALAFSPDGRLLAAPYAGGPMVRLWDLTTRKEVRQLQGKDFQVFRTLFSPDGKVLAGADGSSVTLWDVASGKPCHDFGHSYCINAVAFAPDGKTLVSAATYTDPVIRLWDPLTGKQKAAWHGHVYGMDGLVFSPDGRLVASASQDETIRLWDFATGKEVRRLHGKRGMAVAVAFAPDGKTLASVSKGVLQRWDVATGREIRTFDDLGPTYPDVAFAPDGKTIAVGRQGGKTVQLRDLATGMEVGGLRSTGSPVSRFYFSPDGKSLATTSSNDATVRLWDLAAGRELRTFAAVPAPRDRADAFNCAFSPDGRTLAAGYADRTVRLWEVASGRERARFDGHRAEVSGLAFSPDGTLLASGSVDRTVLVWDVSGQRLAAGRRGAALDTLWADLAAADTGRAFRAVQALEAAGDQTAAFLRERLRPAAGVEAGRLARLVKDLDGDRFEVREQAARDLLKLGDVSEPALRAALAGRPSPELRRRAESLLEQCDPAHSPERLRVLRAVEVLEHVGTPAARQVLEVLCQGAPEARLTREARAALYRLARRPPS
jgi:RNA polymerase sigma factor (sigma-70 family)